jgi:hypothetical protein
MITILDSCKGCGHADFEVKYVDGANFLICKYCGRKLGILENEPVKQKAEVLPSAYIIEYPTMVVATGIYNQQYNLPIYYSIVGSGLG